MNSNKIRIGLSPCPNDTFICDALLNGKIDTEGLKFEAVFADVETLNQMAFRKELDFLKVSYHAFLMLAKDYLLLDSGSALGRDCGPLMIALKDFGLNDLDSLRVAIPGKYTTANLLFSLAFPGVTHKKEMVFSEIEQAVLDGSVDAGIIIHESRFTYQEKGLKALMDLGSFWEGMTGSPIPLGGYIIHRDIEQELREKIGRILHNSVDFALRHPDASTDFVRAHAQEMDDEVIKAHIALYVNDWTRHLDGEAREAVLTLFSEAHMAGIEVYQQADFFA
jgi:1,4-dihydroxy-6-naphthoate synthase